MKQLLFCALALALVGCKKTDAPTPAASEHYLDATSKTEWHYYSFAAAGQVSESADWDIALQRLNIRTKRGVYIFDRDQTDAFGNITPRTRFEDVTKMPETFEPDRDFTGEAMGGGTETVHRSAAVVVQMWRGAQGPVMPPDYRPAPVYVFRTADGAYKVQFTQYKNEANVAGHVKFVTEKLR